MTDEEIFEVDPDYLPSITEDEDTDLFQGIIPPEQLNAIIRRIDELANAGDYIEAQDRIAEIQSSLLPQMIREIYAVRPNVDRGNMAQKAATILKEMSVTIKNKREAQIKDDIDPHSPKFRVLFGWFLELIRDTLYEEDLDDIQISNFFNSIAGKITNWEDRIVKELKGLSGTALQEAPNPFVTDFQETVEKKTKKTKSK